MIISASRRTDIPAFYSKWLYNRIGEQYVLVRNPRNPRQISRIDLSPEVVDGIVFWTKNPAPMLPGLERLKEYAFYFQFTLTPYGKEIEPGLPSKKEVILPAFHELSNRIGADRVIWRYDPILINDRYTAERHLEYFERLAGILEGYTKRCVISFIDSYKNTRKHEQELGLREMEGKEVEELAEGFSGIARRHGLVLNTCCESLELEKYGIAHGQCVDRGLLEKLNGCSLIVGKDPNQRKECGCAVSIDIGSYNTCPNGCRYCYANYMEQAVGENCKKHDPRSPLLTGTVGEEDRVSERKVISFREEQLSLF